MGDPPVGPVPELRSGRSFVGRRVLHVPVLVRLEGARDIAGEPGGHGVVALRRLGRNIGGAQDDFGAIRAQKGLLLHGLLVRHDEDAPIALQHGGDGQAVTGVAAGGLDDRAARLEQARPLRRLDHGQADPVLDGAARIEHLHLGQEQRLAFARAQVARDPADPQQGGVADEIENGFGVLHRRGVYGRHPETSGVHARS